MKPYELTDNEIQDAYSSCTSNENWTGMERIAHEAQKKLLEYLLEPCPHIDEDLGGEGVTNCFRYACSECMQTLLKGLRIMNKTKLLEAINEWDTKTIFGKCRFCGTPLGATFYCFGCRKFICRKCDDFLSGRADDTIIGKHKVEEHRK